MLRQLSQIILPAVLRGAYYGVFHARMVYGILVWGHSAVRVRVFGLQRRAVRIIAGLGYRADVREAFRLVGVLTLPAAYILECVCYVHRHLDEYQSHYDLHDHNTRQRADIYPGHTRLTRGQTGINFYGIKYFNLLPQNVRDLEYRKFRNRIKQFLINGAFYSFEEVTLSMGDLQ